MLLPNCFFLFQLSCSILWKLFNLYLCLNFRSPISAFGFQILLWLLHSTTNNPYSKNHYRLARVPHATVCEFHAAGPQIPNPKCWAARFESLFMRRVQHVPTVRRARAVVRVVRVSHRYASHGETAERFKHFGCAYLLLFALLFCAAAPCFIPLQWRRLCVRVSMCVPPRACSSVRTISVYICWDTLMGTLQTAAVTASCLWLSCLRTICRVAHTHTRASESNGRKDTDIYTYTSMHWVLRYRYVVFVGPTSL